jgi:hypothetical protein
MKFNREELNETLAGHRIPEYMRGGMLDYLCDHEPPGDFLMALFSNDFVNIVGTADPGNTRILRRYAAFFYNDLPARTAIGSPWGSEEAVKAWLKLAPLEFPFPPRAEGEQ